MRLARGGVAHMLNNHYIGFKSNGLAIGYIRTSLLKPLVICAAVWGQSWQGQRVTFLSDNQAVVHVLSSRSAKDPALAHLLRCLFFFEAHFRFEHMASHIPGAHNHAADTLSRNRLTEFHSIFPQAPQAPTPIPTPLTSLLLNHNLVWTSPRWKELFRDCLLRVSPHVLGPHTQSRYLNFCSSFNLVPLPLTERNLCLFVAFLATEGLQAKSISVYLAALRRLQISAGHSPPPQSSWLWLHYVLRGVKLSQTARPRVRLPITAAVLTRLYQVWSSSGDTYRVRLLWATACILRFLSSGRNPSHNQLLPTTAIAVRCGNRFSVSSLVS